jgi:hypothetical protein
MTTDRDNSVHHPTRTSRTEHPAPHELLAYHEKSLTEDAKERIRDHLVVCEECSRVILDFAAFPRIEPRDERNRMSADDLEDQWQDLEQALAARRPVWQRHQVLLPLAAMFFAAAIGLGLWTADLQERIESLEGPSGAVFVAAELRPGGDDTRGEGETIEVPPWARQVLILLNVIVDADYDRYGVDVFASGRGRILTGVPVQKGPEGGFAISLPRSDLAAGEGRIELFGVRDGRRVLLADYRFTLRIDES